MTEEEARAAAEARQRSFERSLAGPSVGKAGLTRDQTEINRIIAEASKVSSFYNNQVRKDAELTRKIQWFQAKRDELLRTADKKRLEAEADKIMVEVEATRDLTQTIVHVDMDAFYASCEVKRDPTLKGKAFGYEARKFGIRSGMAGFIAKKLCPEIILTPLNFDLYIEASKSVREVLLEYDENLMMASLDEGYLNITSYMAEHCMSATEVVTQLRGQVEAKTGLTISAGIASNRMLAKICSDQNKPNGQFELPFDRSSIVRFMRDLPVRKIPGFGRVTERCLEGLGVETCGDIYTKRADLLAMDHWFGFQGLCKAHLGIADNKVEPGKREERKSVGCERTFRDKTDNEDIMNTLTEIAEELGKDLERLEYSGKCVTVKYKLHTYVNKTRAQTVGKYISTSKEILPIAQELLRKELPLRIRLLGIRLSTLKDLTIPDKGIRNFFTSPSKRKRSQEDEIGIIENDEPEIESGLEGSDGEVEELNEEDFRPNSDITNKTGETTHTLSPTCPICLKTLGPGTSNEALNKHVDLCLNKDIIVTAEKTPKRVKVEDKGKKKGKASSEKGTMLAWLKR
ncbi:hypothetical protein TREMEDRAFT_68079 [Tremella mesenterica DSM 1558]|uniref:uncharacterized protein n=1 Tax=Tremella mesenterica (strain ATCC 24925 / CBS 8224 / DSM 1558 / NBRC 9311 / NRRL Y-6157 / RJB 2259-6 / UBC 559-6) TaxID=578456 RepID=UPI0003F4A62D|nr:uncharacterized protein TREMEDRAFT_68079 [Tremella mesenterica DSM 1558]EIW70473.1 hypothetical protein TREMEDRAFT_68079 [Tremella mesenterica DSM 1558]